MAGTDTVSSTGTGDLTAAAALAATGSLTNTGSGGVEFSVALAGTSELSDTGLGLKHYQRFSDIVRVLQL